MENYGGKKFSFVLELLEKNSDMTIAEASRQMCTKFDIEYSPNVRKAISGRINRLRKKDKKISKKNKMETKINKQEGFEFSALDSNGNLMDIDTYCKVHGLDRDSIKSHKLLTHTAIPKYNISFHEQDGEQGLNIEEIKAAIKKELSKKVRTPKTRKGTGTGVVKIADLHCGAYVDNLIRTGDFSINILAQKLRAAAEKINRYNYEKVHVHILGDLIESFTGLSHKNTWKGLDKAMVGAEVVKLCTTILHKDFLDLIENLDQVKIIAGNHDRVTSDNKEDVQGDAANLIGWGLELMGYEVEFHPLVITHIVDNICHIITHGHHAISKRPTQQICWDYGKQGYFNLICEGHLHSIIGKLSTKAVDKFQTIKDDAVDHRRLNVPSFFTGNFYSESLGYTAQSGFIITEDNGNGVPNMFFLAV